MSCVAGLVFDLLCERPELCMPFKAVFAIYFGCGAVS